MIFTQLSQADPVDALATCAAAPAACTNFSTVLVNVVGTGVQSDRRVLELIAQAMARGPEGGTNQFYGSPIATDALRFHADADPVFATETFVQAMDAVLRDAVTARAVDGPDGFFNHMIDGINARLFARIDSPISDDLRARAVALLQRVAVSGLSEAAQRAVTVLGELGEPVTAPAAAPAASTPNAAAALQPVVPTGLSRTTKIAIVVGFGVVAVAGVAILISAARAPSVPTRAMGTGRLRRRVEVGLRRK